MSLYGENLVKVLLFGNKDKIKKFFDHEFTGNPSIKDLLEAIGVPHSEIDLILVNGESVGFDYKMRGGEKVSVYPVFESFDISSEVKLRSKSLRDPKFIADVNLGKLAKKLRILGFDTLFNNKYADKEIIKISLNEKRTILTRDIGLLKHNKVTHGYWIRNTDSFKQAEEVVERFQLENFIVPFCRCSLCNGIIQEVDKEIIKNSIPEKTLINHYIFSKCQICGKIYWKGSHYKKIIKWIDDLKKIK